MSDIINKRLNSEVSSPADIAAKRQELNRPGRKPLNSEPKNKRTAQNRAAQRAFRERKERKMKELEDLVGTLENEKLALHNESEFLRMQVETLMTELTKFRGKKDIDSLLSSTGTLNGGGSGANKHSVSSLSSVSSYSKDDSLNLSTPNSTASSTSGVSGAIGTTSGATGTTAGSHIDQNFTFEFPWSKNHSTKSGSSLTSSSVGPKNNGTDNSSVKNNNPGLTNDSSSSNPTTASTSPDVLDTSNNETNPSKLPMFNSNIRRSSILNEKEELSQQSGDVENQFDEKVSDFCLNLSEVCGSKSCPVPKSLSNASSPFNFVKSEHSVSSPVAERSNSNSNINPQQVAESVAEPAQQANAQAPSQSQSQSHSQSPILNKAENSPAFNETSTSLSPFSTLTAGNDYNYLQDLGNDKLDAYSFLNSTSFDPSLVFDYNDQNWINDVTNNDNDRNGSKLEGLVTEESLYDPLGMFGGNVDDQGHLNENVKYVKYLNPVVRKNDVMKSEEKYNENEGALDSIPEATGDEDKDAEDGKNEKEMVPATDADLMKCSAIWERITSHPKYSELDIDGLCKELKQKAKCSEKGVVVSSTKKKWAAELLAKKDAGISNNDDLLNNFANAKNSSSNWFLS
ncbi:hypothetical protein PACTADRAFT_49285 [Pachysolen tannophilus NRRL Y-2460]|uniref:BZIP domain-containing protein n=1 Tax=Pachysolen tannophilus NRRL Y-2460 TaxID=669874 RepID=A0A1E4TVQ8_PACTA|nr:hypothetical protein PACTADRAFT_49285 [Pachysolen tannophilus NRRL Y-2460]